MKRVYILFLLLLVPLSLAFAGGGAEEPEEEVGRQPLERIGGEVSLVGSWTGNERAVILDMLETFEEETGTTVDYHGTREVATLVDAQVGAAQAPDVVALANPGKMAEWAQEGHLVPIADIMNEQILQDEYSPGWLERGRVDGTLYGIFTKAAMKGLIWYNPSVRQELDFDLPGSWQELLELSTRLANRTEYAPWSIGLESNGTSGWPGTDWIESIFLKMHGPGSYQEWHSGELSWTSREMREVWQEWGEIIERSGMLYGGNEYALNTEFGEAIRPLFEEDPQAVLHHQATFISGFITDAFPGLQAGEGFDFFPFPEINPQYRNSVIAAGDVIVAFNDTPQARQLMRFLSRPEAQQQWLRTGAISPNNAVPLDAYEDPLTRKAAELMGTANVVVFDASDLMPSRLNDAFFAAVLDYVENPGDLDQILQELEEVRSSVF
jgi:alpha-glucoside transport system substrate-binding protein